METKTTNTPKPTDNPDVSYPDAKEMSLLELNAIRLDANRTILTPDYLEELKTKTT